jgi:hypothetical protein
LSPSSSRSGVDLEARASTLDPRVLRRLRRLSYWLDEGIRIPGTRIRIGLDPILGLIPGVGDAAGAILAGAIVVESLRQRISRYAVLRMAANIVIDTVIGSIPVLGDLFDAGWKSNTKNLALLERQLSEPSGSKEADRAFVLVVGGGLLVVCVAVVVLALMVTARVLGWILTQF